ncbi:hypothetical protein DES39_0402 [Orbus hercynius]|uniref:Toxin VasX N-terminal region domain-containing protein n=1 Tax=Orbus hercynius TaxID=593135 RepID=A0A495RID6_9GAMM|nr:toxin VasX [Orbus hercynius]RKS87185.1 hypothetical protein DES39_0402 [Orbus hercynius]
MAKLTAQEQKQIEACRLENASTMANNGCGVCERKGFPLLLVRKSVVPKQETWPEANAAHKYTRSFSDINWAKNMLKLTGREPQEAMETNEFAFRLLRSGYVYVFLRTRGVSDKAKRTVVGYEITPSGCFRHKRVEQLLGIKNHQVKEIPPSCTQSNHHIPAKFITLNNTRYSDAWIAYSPHPWDRQTLEHYRMLPEQDMARFTHVILPENNVAATALTDGRSFSALDFFNETRYLMELQCDEQDRIEYYYDKESRKPTDDTQKPLPEFEHGTFYTASPFYSLKRDQHAFWQAIQRFRRIDVPAVLVEDCLGIAEELAVQKRVAIRPHVKNILEAEETQLTASGKQFQSQIGQFLSTKLLLAEQKNQLKQDNFMLHAMMYDYKDGNAKQKNGQTTNQKMIDDARQQLAKKSAQSPSPFDYYRKEMIYKRRFLTNIENYEQGLIEKDQEAAPADKYVAFFYQSKASDNPVLCLAQFSYETKLNYLDNNMVEIGKEGDLYDQTKSYQPMPLTDDEAQSLLSQFNRSYAQSQSLYDMDLTKKDITEGAAKQVKLYVYTPNKPTSKLDEYRSLLNQPLLDVFKQEVQLSYSWLIADINLLMQDYFYYVTWLIGNQDKCSKFSPKLAQYNQVNFWQQEVQADSSNAHVGYLYDAIAIFKPEHLGSIKLEYQFGIWDNLLRDENTLYVHLLKGQRSDNHRQGLWQTLLALRDKPENQGKTSDELITLLYQQQNQTVADKQRHNPSAKSIDEIDTEVLDKLNDLLELDLPKDPNQAKLVSGLFDVLFEQGYAAIANMPRGEVINRVLTQGLLAESSNVLFGVKMRTYSFNVPARDLRYTLNRLQTLNPAINKSAQYVATTAQGKSITLTRSEKGWQVPKAYWKTLVTIDVVVAAGSLDELDDIQKQFKQSKTLNQFVKSNPYVLHVDSGLTRADIDKAFRFKQRQIAVEEGKTALFSGLLLALNIYNLSSKYGAYDLTIGQDVRDKMRAEMSRAVVDCLLLLPPIFDSGLKNGAALFRILRTNTIESQALARSSSLLGVGNKVAGGIGAIFVIYDGASSCVSGYQRYQRGEATASAYLVGSLCQISSGLLGVIGLFCLNPLIGLAAFVFGVVAFILLTWFKDQSDDWTLMQIWFNRCYFGLWSHKASGKGEPYPLTDVGAYIACNDYLVALLNCQVQMAIEDSAASYPNLESGMVPAGFLPSLQRKVQLNMLLADFDPNKSDYQGRIVIRSKLFPDEFVVLSLSFNEKYIDVVQKQSTLSNWQQRSMLNVKLDAQNKERSWLLDENGERVDGSPFLIMTNPNNGITDNSSHPILFLDSSQIIGWIKDDDANQSFTLEVVVHYYRDKSNNSVPLVLCYEY